MDVYGWYKTYLQGSWDRVGGEKIVKEYLKHDYFIAKEHEPRGLFIQGDVGTGKSTLVGLIAIWFLKTFNISMHFIPTSMLFDKIFQRQFEEIERLMKAKLVCLDDLGREYGADFPLSKFENFIEYRYANLVPTFITSNLKLDDLRKRPGFERIADRINDPKWMNILTIAGGSLRVR